MQKCFAEGSGPVYRDVIAWLRSSDPQLQLSGALAIANFARNGKILAVHLAANGDLSDLWILLTRRTSVQTATA